MKELDFAKVIDIVSAKVNMMCSEKLLQDVNKAFKEYCSIKKITDHCSAIKDKL